METHIRKYNPVENSIYIIAESGTTNDSFPPIYVAGCGSLMEDRETLEKRATKKLIAQSLALSLIEVAMSKNEPQWVQSFWNTYKCQNMIVSSGNYYYGYYCKNRFCPICLGIRKADKINMYLSTVNSWPQPYLLTLTLRTCIAKELDKRIDDVIDAFSVIKDRCRKRHQRGNGIKVMGLKSIECNFNPRKNTYNPHFHIIVPNEETAFLLKREWLKYWTEEYALWGPQNIRIIRNTERDMKELVKYGSKIFTELDVYKGRKEKGNHKLYVAALYNILTALKGHRIFDRFGFNLSKTIKPKCGTITKLEKYDEWEYNPKFSDWTSVYSGELLTEYKPSFWLMQLLENNIDTGLE